MPAGNQNTLPELLTLHLKDIPKEVNIVGLQLYEKSTSRTISRVLTTFIIFKGEWIGILMAYTDTVV